MLSRVKRWRPQPATIISCIALFVALSGVAYAASLPKNSVGTKQIKKNAVTSSKIKAKNVANSDLKDGAVDSVKLADGSVARADLAGDVNASLDAPKVTSYSTASSASVSFAGETNKTVISRSLPAGTFAVNGKVELTGASSVADEWFNIGCRLINTPTSGSATNDFGSYYGSTDSYVFIIPAGSEVMPFSLIVNQAVDSTIAIQCSDVAEGATSYTATAADAAITAIKVDSSN